jgi:hypothetical protein
MLTHLAIGDGARHVPAADIAFEGDVAEVQIRHHQHFEVSAIFFGSTAKPIVDATNGGGIE